MVKDTKSLSNDDDDDDEDGNHFGRRRMEPKNKCFQRDASGQDDEPPMLDVQLVAPISKLALHPISKVQIEINISCELELGRISSSAQNHLVHCNRLRLSNLVANETIRLGLNTIQ